jgi:lipopolysaccharide heptosyltransferase II
LNPTGRPRADPGKILLIRLRRIGDVVMTSPAAALLKKGFPAASVTYLVEEPYRRLVEGLPAVDRVIAVPANQRFGDFLGLVRRARRERFDALLDFHGGPRASWITAASGARLKIGYAIERKGFLYDVRVPRRGPDGPIHSVRNHVNLVRAMGVDIEDAEIPLLTLPAAASEETARVDRIVREAAAPKLVVLHIGAGNRFRDWGAANAASLVRLLAGTPGVRIALIGADGDRTAEAEILRAAPSAVLPLAGRLNLIEIRELIARAALYVGPDSGPMHIAASTATPLVAYFGPTLPAVFAPWRPGGEPTVILEKGLDCRPCRQRECVTADYRCLLTITPEEVYEACRRFLL